MIDIGRWESAFFMIDTQAKTQFADALLALADTPEERRKCYEMRLADARKFERYITARVHIGNEWPHRADSRVARIEAEIAYRAGTGKEPPPLAPPKDGAIAPPVAAYPMSRLHPWVAAAVESQPTDSALMRLRRERAREYASAVDIQDQFLQLGRWEPDFYREFADTRNKLSESLASVFLLPENLLECRRMRLAGLREFERVIAERVEQNYVWAHYLDIVRADRLDAEIELLRFQQTLAVVCCDPCGVMCAAVRSPTLCGPGASSVLAVVFDNTGGSEARTWCGMYASLLRGESRSTNSIAASTAASENTSSSRNPLSRPSRPLNFRQSTPKPGSTMTRLQICSSSCSRELSKNRTSKSSPPVKTSTSQWNPSCWNFILPPSEMPQPRLIGDSVIAPRC